MIKLTMLTDLVLKTLDFRRTVLVARTQLSSHLPCMIHQVWHESGTVHSEMCCNTFITIIKEQNIGTFFSQVCFIGLQTLQLFHVVQ